MVRKRMGTYSHVILMIFGRLKIIKYFAIITKDIEFSYHQKKNHSNILNDSSKFI